MEFTCTDCSWTTHSADGDPETPSERAIAHHVDSGHRVERIDEDARRPTDRSRFRIR